MTVSAPQLGKSLTLGLWLLAGAWTDAGATPEWPTWWAAPTYEQARSGFLRYMVRPALNAGILEPGKYTTTVPLRAVLINGSVVEGRSWDKPEGLYGPTVARIGVDEFGLLTDAAWAALSSRTTETAIHGKGLIRMAGNVSEVGGMAEKLYRIAMAERPGWAARTWTWRMRANAAPCECGLNGSGCSIDTAELHAERCERGIYLRDLASRREVMSAAHFRQLYEAEWLDWSALPAYTFDRTIHVTADVHEQPNLPLDLSCDFNRDPMAWVVGQATRDEAWALDEICVEGGATTDAACTEFLRRYPGSPTRELRVFGDAAGKAGTTKSTETDYSIIRQRLEPHWPRLRMMVPAANPPVSDRVNAVNAMLRNAAGKVRYYLHPRCTHLADDLARVSFKPGTRDLDKTNKRLTHFSDADGYRLFSLFPVGAAQVVVAHAGREHESLGHDSIMEMAW